MSRIPSKIGIGRWLALPGMAMLVLTLSAGCVAPPPPGTVFVASAPPVAQVEVVGVGPGPEFVWVPGYHHWDGGHYVWVSGRWERRPHANATWQPGAWRHHTSGWYWTEGRWR